jgi:hypothetical protein
MAVTFRDDFTRLTSASVTLTANPTPDGTHIGDWSLRSVDAGRVSNAKGTTTTGRLGFENDTSASQDIGLVEAVSSASSDMRVKALLMAWASFPQQRLVARSNGSVSTLDAYCFLFTSGTWAGANGTWTLQRADAGTLNNIASGTFASSGGPLAATNELLELEVIGTGATIDVWAYRNGTKVNTSYTGDSNANRKTSGAYAGLYSQFARHEWDYFEVDDLTAGGGDTNVDLDKFTLSLSGKTATAQVSVSTTKATLTINERELFTSSDASVALDKASLSFTGSSLTANVAVPILPAELTLTGKVALGNVSIDVAAVALTISEKTFNVDAGNSVTLDKVALSWTGQTAFGAVSVPLAKANISITENTVTGETSVSINKVSLIWTGKTVTVLANIVVAIDKAVLTIVEGSVAGSNGVIEWCRGIVRPLIRDLSRALTRRTSC